MSPIRRAFALLLVISILLLGIFYVSDISLLTFTSHHTWFMRLLNQTYSSDLNASSVSNHHKNIQQRATTPQDTTVVPEHHHLVYPRNYLFTIDEPDLCKNADPFLVLMVPVAPHELAARNAIRRTWGNESTIQGKAVITLFLVALVNGADREQVQEQLEVESREHRDLLQSNFVDSYFNLTIKTMVIMDWLATRCPQAAYAMKVDSDMYLNLENLMTVLLAPTTPKENYITGYMMWNRPVVRNKNSKWYVSEDLYPEDTYPTYLLGMGYVFSNDLPEKLIGASKDVKPFNIEDAYVGACLKRLGIEPTSPPEPARFRAYLGKYLREDFFWVITTILGSPQQLIDIWNDVHSGLTKQEQAKN